jgi:hypothetical protein
LTLTTTPKTANDKDNESQTYQNFVNAIRSPATRIVYLNSLPEDIEESTKDNEYDVKGYDMTDSYYPYKPQSCMGVDPGWGSSNFAITITNFVDGVIRVLHSEHYSRPNHKTMVDLTFDLIQKYNVTKTCHRRFSTLLHKSIKDRAWRKPSI